MWYVLRSCAPLTHFLAPWGAPQKAPVAKFVCGTCFVLAHPSHISWPHGELHRRPQWQSSYVVRASFLRTPHTFPGPMGSSTEGPSGKVRMWYVLRFCAPLTHFLAPWGAPQKAPVAKFVC